MIIPEQEFGTLLEWAEDRLARAGFAVVSAEVRVLMDDMECRISAGLPVGAHEYEAVRFAFWSGPIAQYYEAKEFA